MATHELINNAPNCTIINNTIEDTTTASGNSLIHYDVSLKVNEGYIIDSTTTPNLVIKYYTTNYYEYKVNLKLNTDTNIWSATGNTRVGTATPSNFESATINAVTQQVTPIVEKFPIIDVFKVNQDIMTQLANKRFYEMSDSGISTYKDLGEYILSYVRYPFDIETTEEKNIILGFVDTEITCSIVPNYTYTLDFGSVDIKGIYENKADIDNTDIRISLKYFGFIDIDSKYINSKISVKIIVDIITNTANVYIYSNDVIIDSKPITLGYSVPYILTTEKINVYNKSDNTVITLSEFENYIEVIQKNNDSNLLSSNKEIDIKDCKGYFKFDNINIKDIPTTEELDLITSTLSNGIYL